MPRYLQSAITAKRGINHVRTTVEGAGSLFIKIDQESDLGIDAIVELVHHGKPLNRQVAVQIKSGQSYYDAEAGECLIPIGDHREYWSRYSLPVYGIVFVPTLKAAHWVNIKSYLKTYPDAATVRYAVTEANRFDEKSFAGIFVPGILGQAPTLSIEEAFRLIRSPKLDEAYLAIVVLFRRYPNTLRVWDEFVYFLQTRPASQIPGHLIYFLAHIPGHADIAYHGEQLAAEALSHARQLIDRLGYEDVIKILHLIDRENSISRGSLGQSVEAVISSLPASGDLLRQTIADTTNDLFIRECAGLILAMNEGIAVAPLLAELAGSGSWYAGEMLAHLKEWGHVNPYA